MMPSSSSASLSLQPFDEAYEIANCSRRVKIVLDDYRVHCRRFEATGRGRLKRVCRKEFETANKQLCIKNALKWPQRLIALRVIR